MRRTPLRPSGLLARAAAIRRVSKKRVAAQRIYGPRSRAFLADKCCRVCEDLGVAVEFKNPRGELVLRMCATEVHHMRGRVGTDYLDERWWLPVCRDHHERITRDPLWALEHGYSLRRVS